MCPYSTLTTLREPKRIEKAIIKYSIVPTARAEPKAPESGCLLNKTTRVKFDLTGIGNYQNVAVGGGANGFAAFDDPIMSIKVIREKEYKGLPLNQTTIDKAAEVERQNLQQKIIDVYLADANRTVMSSQQARIKRPLQLKKNLPIQNQTSL